MLLRYYSIIQFPRFPTCVLLHQYGFNCPRQTCPMATFKKPWECQGVKQLKVHFNTPICRLGSLIPRQAKQRVWNYLKQSTMSFVVPNITKISSYIFKYRLAGVYVQLPMSTKKEGPGRPVTRLTRDWWTEQQRTSASPSSPSGCAPLPSGRARERPAPCGTAPILKVIGILEAAEIVELSNYLKVA